MRQERLKLKKEYFAGCLDAPVLLQEGDYEKTNTSSVSKKDLLRLNKVKGKAR
jgi:hypothetical protein